MTSELIRLNPTHISVEQMRMPVDLVLQCYICNMPAPLSPLIEDYLCEAVFGTECTIPLEDVQLQLGLSVDGIKGGRIKIGWLRDTFPEPDEDSTELERIRYARAYILEIIGGQPVNFAEGLPCWQDYTRRCAGRRYQIKPKSEVAYHYSNHRHGIGFHFPRVNHPHTFPLITRWNHSVSYVGIPTSLEDIRLLLDQRSEAQFQWTPYEDSAIQAVPMVTYAIVEIHQSDRVLRQFGFQQPIPMAPEKLDDEHKTDLRQLNTDWPRY
ncbi:hypothetical protein J1N35_006024 [Gossypium stocksii]|uniref:Aminotransferase-like plant mobile domain-containing protein n=1 Tax=Gossypium stocksii TaxID=47602 RepID=A0A9D3WE33_9ROSI|nr:hypothetical protein J1N35_006024 [Gossypium stocksii]